MYTMIYDAEALKPELLIKQGIKNGDIWKSFGVINGAWFAHFKDLVDKGEIT